MKIQINKEFENREELDTYVRVNFGEDKEKNKDIVLELTDVEMEKLSLSDESTVHGTKIRKQKADTLEANEIEK